MKTPLIITTFLLGIFLKTNAQTNFEKVALSTNVSISFPSKPTESGTPVQKNYILSLEDGTANLLVTVTDLKANMGVDAALLEIELQKDETWDQAKVAFLASLGQDVKLIAEKMISIQNTKALKLIIEKVNDKDSINTYTVIIFVNDIYAFNVIHNNIGGKGEEKMKEAFLESIQIKKQ